MLTHLNVRIKTDVTIKLPFQAIYDQFMNPNVASFVKNFTIIYLEIAFYRSSMEVNFFKLHQKKEK